CQQESNWSWTF
nr:immunoglobulin light chain junction region [Macaca mulatta]MOV61501.1 immunoglobulin light chain junction region [Macaca mulatta]MOV61582.1 immunoglobulin light chain junction region [Macaca mulatta]MOV61919.1 immunoglobulin light chain junction region [Macaca mulatta]MOV61934.1 immunoglobulin light chain junction region [Macaca mulatta]